MEKGLFSQAISKFVLGVLVVGILLFLPAGTLRWREGWLLMGILFVPMFFAGLVMLKRSPDLLKKRLSAKETEGEQKQVVLFLLAYLMYAEVLRENAYLSRTIEVQSGQKVIDTGLYGVVRHPMYAATLLLFLAMPFVLGSLISFLIMLCYIPLIAKRMKNEEAVLLKGLPGYGDYMKKVRYRVIPFVW